MSEGVTYETEIRARVDDLDWVRTVLKQHGFSWVADVQQLDIVFDRPGAELFRAGSKIRFRIEGGTAELTYKGPTDATVGMSTRREISLPMQAQQLSAVSAFLEQLGFPECFRIPKRREIFKSESVTATLDHWPIIGCLLEVEGAPHTLESFRTVVMPQITFGNPRLRELFRETEREAGKSLSQLQAEWEEANGERLGDLGVLLGD